ncbi:motility protein A [Pelovirga terrestris]|uniref:MotA/TolQ/ExbB proton channel family protein n=1 Tax=Pelovirga terrestris TaxID=2771352 RepID=A0A8J6R5M4_9BACT|nr:MotA/TolQ/ExbB proton channel family protein [Pelovirga terrestris]MBD1400434.1 MotA/TolQ/ExbB proton channel family protein [Pelovirga terrestris]
MDLATIVGLIAAFGLMITAIMQGSSLLVFVDIAALTIVIGGTFGTVLVHFPFSDILGAVKVAGKAFRYKAHAPTDTISRLITYAGKARKEGILSLQAVMNDIDDEFFLKGLQMAVDGQEPEALKEMLEREIEYVMERHDKGAEIFSTFAAYSPAMGMIGTLIGLVQMLQTMDDPSTIGPAMAVALLTTFYGAIIANIIANPIAGKLKLRSASEVLNKTLVTEGMKAILEGENPRLMEQRLHAFVAPKERRSNFG